MALIGSSGNYRMFIRTNREGIKVFSLIFFFMAFLGLGAYLFLVIESPEEAAAKNVILKAKLAALEKYPNVPGEAIDFFLKELSKNGVKGITTDNTTKWTMGNSVLYVTTLLTTIGYGHLSTSTVLGKIVCMIFTSIGIPLTLYVLSAFVDRLHKLSDFFLGSLYYRLKSSTSLRKIRMVHFFIVTLFIVVGCFLFPAFIFSLLETSWSYFDSVYFCFITLTTVGLGDYVPGLNMKHPLVDLYRFGSAVYMFIGVTIMMFFLALMSDFVINFNKPFQETRQAVIVPSEKLTICNEDRPPSYGTIIVQVTKTCEETETQALLP